MWDLDIP